MHNFLFLCVLVILAVKSETEKCCISPELYWENHLLMQVFWTTSAFWVSPFKTGTVGNHFGKWLLRVVYRRKRHCFSGGRLKMAFWLVSRREMVSQKSEGRLLWNAVSRKPLLGYRTDTYRESRVDSLWVGRGKTFVGRGLGRHLLVVWHWLGESEPF